tara:strand:+ start:511 stop:699 length:189 start_codon:yes stop_codon:yes gene_type:complete
MANINTPEEAMAAVKKNGSALKDVPEELITPEMCMLAVTQNGGCSEIRTRTSKIIRSVHCQC